MSTFWAIFGYFLFQHLVTLAGIDTFTKQNKTNVSNDKPGETKTSMEEERVLGAEQV